MAELFPQDTSTATTNFRSRSVSLDLIRAEGIRRGPVQPTTLEEPPADWATSPLYRAPELPER